MNNEDIKKILSDLYAVDPTLRSREKDLVTIIRAMAIRPEAHYDPAFAANLRARVLTELARSGDARTQGSFAAIFAGRSFRYAVLGIAVIAIAAVSFAAFGPFSKNNGPVALNTGNVDITSVGANAFGPLQSLGAGSGGTAAAQPTGASGSGSASAPSAENVPAAAPMSAAGTNSASSDMAVVPARPIVLTTVKYDYIGSPISQDQAQLDVLKKVAAPLTADQATAALEQAEFGQIGLSTFTGLGMSNVTLDQDQSFGYEISLDLTDGTISINENYNEWPQDSATTTPLAASDIPSDSAVVAVANQFMAAHDISTADYGAPTVTPNTGFAVPLAATAMPMIPYYPDTEQVLYPLIVNGLPVYNTAGDAIGLMVEVNVRYGRVESVNGLQTEDYQSSAYDAITDTSTILSIAENPETYPVMYGAASGPVNGDVTTYDLGTPTMVYEDMYQTASNGQSSEFLVPAFAFPVVVGASDTASAQNIMVPLIQDFEQEQQGSVIVPRPMPLAPVAQ